MEIYPRSIYDLLLALKEEYPGTPIVITENGVGNYDTLEDGQIHDQYRIDYLKGYVEWIEKALEEGCPVLGYFVWSTMDVYSWINGYKKRYGLVYIDYDSEELRRIPKDSYYWYKNIIEGKRRKFDEQVHKFY
jgi:beta-glucosidase/6-phospho-beta-glucosidase/beta-galactosidase